MAKWVLATVIFLLAIESIYTESEAVFDVNFSVFRDNKAELNNFNVIEGTALLEDQPGDYKLIILSSSGEVLYKTYFNVQFETHEDIIVDGKRQSKDRKLDKVEIHVRVPFDEKANRLEVYHKDREILSKKIELCNSDKVCNISGLENYFNCPFDCHSGSNDGHCDRVLDGICDNDCIVKELDIDCTCGNKVCDERENIKVCKVDCKVSLWQKIIRFIKSIFSLK